VINVIVLWGAQAITRDKGNQLAVLFGYVLANTEPNALRRGFGGMTGIVTALLGLRSKLSAKLGKSASFEWLLTIASVVFFILLSIIISWTLLLFGQQPWIQAAAQSFGLSIYQSPLFGVFCL